MVEATVEQKLKSLYNLQLIDSEIDQIHGIRGELPMEVSDLEDEIAGLETRIQNLKTEMDELKKEIDERKNGIKESNTLIAKYEAQQNNVKNNREFLALSKEVEMQKLEIMASEKKIKDYASQVDDRKTQLEATKANMEERSKDLEHKKGELDSITAETQKEEDQLMAVRDKAASFIDERLRNAYIRIRSNVKNKMGVVSIDRDACAGCFSKIPPQRQLDIRQRKKVIVCENCGRILIDNELAEETRQELQETKVV
ncbi:MAG: C4-type zinc ribbon domain-containing protein [Bacteroidota bacterium]|nr:C4-type zinc ribbon domain-containing protein [Bacteroidota bacterium]